MKLPSCLLLGTLDMSLWYVYIRFSYSLALVVSMYARSPFAITLKRLCKGSTDEWIDVRKHNAVLHVIS